ncbi:lysosomal alpha-glucosidase [Anabrus simplex]|uniref:lysosomal alpha-glucosidase n=1 Tax=Anabrus simplex TaxID=316456 RepID=UPI0035A38091
MHTALKNFVKKCKDSLEFINYEKKTEKCDKPVDQATEQSQRHLFESPSFNERCVDSPPNPEDLEPFVQVDDSRFPCPNVAIFLVIILLSVVFILLPVVYLLHCFDLLSAHWPEEQFRRVLTDHSHSNPGKVAIHSESAECQNKSDGKNTLANNYFERTSETTFLQCSNIPDIMKFDCYPESGATEPLCKQRGCCWLPRKWEDTTIHSDVTVGVPYCFYPMNYGGYKFLNISKIAYGMTAYLERTFKSPYPDDIKVLRMDVKYETQYSLHIKLVDPSVARFEPPYPEVVLKEKVTSEFDYIVEVDEHKVGFKIIRKSTNVTIFNCQDVGGFIFANQFLQLSSLLPSSNIYGLGEHQSSLRLSTQWERFVLFNHDAVPIENMNLYGSHPFYLIMEDDGNSHGTFLLNSNAMEIILQPAPAITFRSIGGILNFYFFLGPTPADVIHQYTDLIGRPYMPPYWGLGFHLCRFGYKSLNHTKEVWSRTREAGIPLDVQWNDLDYMDSNNDFTYDKVKYEGLPQFVEELHELGMHYVPLIDPGVSAGEKPGSYPPYDEGIAMDIFIKNSTGQPFIGKVWNRISTVWPDFTHPRTVDYWVNELQRFHSQVAFDGAWIDMNEPSNFYSGTAAGCPKNNLDYPPYVPAVDGQKLFYKTLCMSSLQEAGSHYNTHNLYGFSEAIVTSFALAEIRGLRPFVISRSTFSGHGHYAGHWSGDVWSDWYSMKKSISQLLSFSLFGIPLMGADICGFNGNTTAPLCQRWMQLGAFYPFSRNHNTDDGIPQDPVALGPEVVEAARKALLIRYSLLPYLYTLFWLAHAVGDTVARPLFFEFPGDINTYGLDEQFLWGPALMIVPVLSEGKTSVLAYLPQAIWYNWYTLAPITEIGSNGWITLEAPLDTIPLLVRGGYVLPMQAPNMTTTASRKNPFELIVAADKTGYASGSLYWDDGDSLNTYEDHRYILLNFTLKNSQLVNVVTWWGYDVPLTLNKIAVLGVATPVKAVYVNQAAYPFSYNTINKFLKIENLVLPLNKAFTVHWI